MVSLWYETYQGLMVTCTVIQPEKQLDAFLLSFAMLLLFGCVSCWTTIASIAVNEAVRAEAEQVRGRLKFMALRRVIGTHGCLFLAIACVIVMILLLCLNDFVLVAVILAISASCCCFPAAWSFLKPQDDIDPEEVKNLCAEVCKNTIVFEGSILPGQPCICSWPGKYESAWEVLVYSSRKHRLSAAVVFLPEGSKHFGCHDAIPPEEELEGECWCVPLYGAKQVWGCRWWSLWMANIEKAVAQNAELEVYFFQKKKGQGKVPFEMVGQEHQKREAIYSKKKDFEESLMFQKAVATGLQGLSEEKLGDSSSRYSREWRRLFLAWLPEAERQILEEAEGLGNSQKAEVAWLEKKKYKYTEVEVDVSKWNMPDEEVTPSSDSSQNP